MVKFGKKLEHGGLKIPRWKNKYVNYNMLKKYIIFFLVIFIKYHTYSQCLNLGTINSQNQLDSLSDCEIIEGNLVLNGSDISDLSSLSSLSVVTGIDGSKRLNFCNC